MRFGFGFGFGFGLRLGSGCALHRVVLLHVLGLELIVVELRDRLLKPG